MQESQQLHGSYVGVWLVFNRAHTGQAANFAFGTCPRKSTWVIDAPQLSSNKDVSISSQLAAEYGVTLGDSVTVERRGGQQHAEFVIAEIRPPTDPRDPSVLGMNIGGRKRLVLSGN